MKIDRLLGILAVLSRQDKATALELAEKFEVSRRTITRDVDVLCAAGIPIVTEQGRGGGISIAPGFRLDRQVFTGEELQTLLSGLQGVESVSPRQAALKEKLAAGPAPDLLIDLASHYKASLTEKIALLRKAISENRLVSFRYYAEQGESLRTAEPCRIAFQWGDWYLLAWCRQRQDFRLFKLSRLWELSLLPDRFTPREIPPQKLDFSARWQENYRLDALFAPDVKYRLVEEYGPSCFTEQPDGKLRFSVDFTFYNAMLSWVLSFGDAVEVLAPAQLRQDLLQIGTALSKRYKNPGT